MEPIMTKRILIYGDSNTYGYNAIDGSRFDANTRWTGVCQKELGPDYEIINRGLNGRTTCHDTWEGAYFNGLARIEACVASQKPLDMICVKLGSNDLDVSLKQTPEMIAENAARVLKKAREAEAAKAPEHPCQYVLMAPLHITEDAYSGPFAPYYDEKSLQISAETTTAFARQAQKDGFLFFDANQYARCGKFDGVHLDAENHRKMGIAVAKWLQENII